MTMKPREEDVHTILFITLSNLGDIILTTPVLEKLHDEFPRACIDVITGPSGKDIFSAHPAVREITVHKKRQAVKERLKRVISLRRKRYDLVVDLKNSLIPYIIGARFHSGFLRTTGTVHKRDEHLLKLRCLNMVPFSLRVFPGETSGARFFIPVTDHDKNYVSSITLPPKGKKVVISPGAKSHLKRWDAKKYAILADRLVSELGCEVFMTGNSDDREVIRRIISCMAESAADLCCKTSIGALAELMSRADLVITNDSAPLHVASAVNTPTVAIFGPSDERKYGPLADGSVVIKPEVSCRPCGKALCALDPEGGCISQVEVEEVFRAAKGVLYG
jgi:lipopolysaccharide heptosyltransferase II